MKISNLTMATVALLAGSFMLSPKLCPNDGSNTFEQGVIAAFAIALLASLINDIVFSIILTYSQPQYDQRAPDIRQKQHRLKRVAGIASIIAFVMMVIGAFCVLGAVYLQR